MNPVQRSELGRTVAIGRNHGFLRDYGESYSFEPFAGIPLSGLTDQQVERGIPRDVVISGRSEEELRDDRSMAGMVMEFGESPFSFAHRSYDNAPQVKSAKGRKNDHLTIENSLPAMLAVAKRDPRGMYGLLGNRIHKQKPSFNELLNAHEYGEIDNLHFRPGAEDQIKANGGDGGVAPVDERISLRKFLDFVDSVADSVRVSETIRRELRASAKAFQGSMGLTVDEMYFGTSGRKDLAKFVVLARKLTGQEVPDELEGLSKVKAELKYQEQIYREGEGVNKESGLAFNEVVKILIGNQDTPGQYWPNIVEWATNIQPTGAAGTGGAVHAMAG